MRTAAICSIYQKSTAPFIHPTPYKIHHSWILSIFSSDWCTSEQVNKHSITTPAKHARLSPDFRTVSLIHPRILKKQISLNSLTLARSLGRFKSFPHFNRDYVEIFRGWSRIVFNYRMKSGNFGWKGDELKRHESWKNCIVSGNVQRQTEKTAGKNISPNFPTSTWAKCFDFSCCCYYDVT